jgi:tetratricopeptide (TPR) repeat protein
VGDLYQKEGETEQAIKEYFRVADLYAEEDLNLPAISIYKRVLSIDPKMIEALHKIANLYIKEGLFGSARSYYQSILRIRPDDVEARRALANPPPVESPREESFNVPAEEPHAEARWFNPEVKTAPDPSPPSPAPPLELPEADILVEPEPVTVPVDKDSEMHYHLGIAYKEMELYDYAISEFEMASSSEAMKFDCCIMLGDCYMEKGLPDKSIECYQVASDIKGLSDEKMARLHFNLGLAYEANGMATEAVQAFGTALKFDPALAEAKEKIGNLEKSPSR